MVVNIGQIKEPVINIHPSKKLVTFLRNINISAEIPVNIRSIVFKNKTKETPPENASIKTPKPEYLTTESDEIFIKSLKLGTQKVKEHRTSEASKVDYDENTSLSLSDLHWIYNYIQAENKNNDEKIYLHELLEESKIVLPKNIEIPRSEELEKRCRKLRVQQQNREYQNMTKNVDNLRRRLPEDTISYQLKQLNRQLIAIFQFIVTVIAGFAFGFVGVELIVGSLDFGFRLLLGIICALIIALAELYFLAKRLNEDLQFEYTAASRDKATNKTVKVD